MRQPGPVAEQTPEFDAEVETAYRVNGEEAVRTLVNGRRQRARCPVQELHDGRVLPAKGPTPGSAPLTLCLLCWDTGVVFPPA